MSYRVSLKWIYTGITLLLTVFSANAIAQENASRPSGSYRVMPQFPGEQTAQPGQPSQPVQAIPPSQSEGGPRRAIVIHPDGTVSGQNGQTIPDEPSAFPAQPIQPAQPAEIVPQFLPPGASGMDGIPIEPSRPIAVQVEYPSDRQIIATQEVDVFIKLENYKLGEKDSGGNRLHYILDNGPPQPIYDAISPITFRNLSQGGHTIRIFAVRPDGRMFRNQEAFAMRHFYVIRKDFQNYTDPQKEYLTVNLPTGQQVATDEQGRIIFDYKLHNINSGEGFELRYKIGAYEGFLTQDGPVYWSNLATGKHKIEVELLRENRQPVIGPFNQVERDFTVEKVMRAEVFIPGEEDVTE